VGLHGGLDGGWEICQSGIAVFGRGDVGVLAAGSREEFTLAMTGPAPVGPSTNSQHGPGFITTLCLQAGMGYTVPLERVWLQARVGYGFEAWLLHATGNGARDHALFQNLDFTSHGPFCRLEIGY
jgi:hypothetical protein